MTEKEKHYKSNKPDYSVFGGIIYNYDFDGYIPITDVASRIACDWNFDKKCKELGDARNRRKQNKKGII